MDDNQLLKFIAGDATFEEQQKVIDWFGESDENKKTFSSLKNLSVAAEILSEDYQKNIFRRKTITKRLYSWSFRAASVLIIALSFFYFGKKNEHKTWMEVSKHQNTEISVPLGESVSLSLPDGSTVKLNSGSTFRYSGLYGYNMREVYLEGEGYFKVKKGDKKFVVKTAIFNIEVYGTVFNVSAYKDDRQVSASLYSGKVEVKNFSKSEDIILKPNSCYTFDKITEKSEVKNITKKQNWTESYFVAESDDIDSFVKKIERKYKVKIIVNPKLSGKCIYTGTFRSESLTDILNNMALASPIKYEIRNDNIVIINPI
ncbi:MAG: FecR family protein [Thiovulaceae bacterium]|nr:FecR family protein [Sulfurimonadaceae bacterium]